MTESGFTIRNATAADQQRLGELGGELVRLHAGWDPRRFLSADEAPDDRYAQFLMEQARGDDAVVLVAVTGSTVAGYVFAALEPESLKELRGPAGFVHDLVVAENARGRGIGRSLVTAALEWLKARGAARVLLWTAPRNLQAQRLFRTLGFRDTMIEFTRDWPD